MAPAQGGAFFVADMLNHRILRFEAGQAEGVVVAGGKGEGPGCDVHHQRQKGGWGPPSRFNPGRFSCLNPEGSILKKSCSNPEIGACFRILCEAWENPV